MQRTAEGGVSKPDWFICTQPPHRRFRECKRGQKHWKCQRTKTWQNSVFYRGQRSCTYEILTNKTTPDMPTHMGAISQSPALDEELQELTITRGGRRSLPQGWACWLVIQYQVVNPKTYTQAVLNGINRLYLYTYMYRSMKNSNERREGAERMRVKLGE